MLEVKCTRACSAAWSSSGSLPRETARAVECQDTPALLHRRLVDLDRDDVDAVAGEHLDDAGTHGAESDDTDLAELTSHAASLSEQVCRVDPRPA